MSAQFVSWAINFLLCDMQEIIESKRFSKSLQSLHKGSVPKFLTLKEESTLQVYQITSILLLELYMCTLSFIGTKGCISTRSQTQKAFHKENQPFVNVTPR